MGWTARCLSACENEGAGKCARCYYPSLRSVTFHQENVPPLPLFLFSPHLCVLPPPPSPRRCCSCSFPANTQWISPSSVHWRTWAQGLPIGWASFWCCYKHPLEVSYTCTLIYVWFISCKSKYTQYEDVVWHLLTQCVSLCTAFFFR